MVETQALTCDDCGKEVQLHRGGHGSLHMACGCERAERIRGVKVSSVIPEAWQ